MMLPIRKLESPVTASSRRTSNFDRVLVVDPNITTAKLLANLLRAIWPASQVYGAQDAERAMALAAQVAPELVFVEAARGFDGMGFTRDFRRSDLAAREAPVIMVFDEVKAAQLLAARDVGVHEFLRRPISMGDLEKRLAAVSGQPRDWIEGVNYVGPDRRRFNSADYQGPTKRRTDGTNKKGQKINQALRIIQAAGRQLEAEPVQAARALSTQARILIELATGQPSLKRLGAAAALLQAYLQTAASHGAPLAKDQVETHAANVLQAAPEAARPKAA